MTQPKTEGHCLLCKRTTAKESMTAHLKSCLKKAAADEPSGKRVPRAEAAFHLAIDGRYLPIYWLHVLVRADASFADLDAFLRHIWLECCGHMSQFIVGNAHFVHQSWMEGDKPMETPLARVLQPRMTFFHEYDFGTTTELKLRVAREVQAPFERNRPVRLLARNDPPEIECCECGKPATELCTQCMYEDAGPLCDRCAKKHSCDEEMLLPIVNSPRVGQCGYTGPVRGWVPA